jgi:dihydrolipoamide dehydrogenase
MVVGEVAERADVVIIGAGPGGYAAALRCADLLDVHSSGARVILVERRAVGGVCLNVGCIPSKVLIHSAEVADLGRRSSAWGVDLQTSVDLDRLQQHRRDTVNHLTGGVVTLLDHAGVERWEGSARFSRPDRLAIVQGDDIRHLEFGHCVIATGSRPSPLPALPFDGEHVVDSTSALEFASLPRHLVVIGGGYIGLELGTAWAKLGSDVSIVEGTDRLLPAMDPALGRVVRRRLDEIGVSVHLNRMIEGADDPLLTKADRILVAIGRTPNTDDLGLDIAGVPLDDDGRIIVGPDRRAADNILAIGDVTPGPALAHKATAEAEVAASVIAGRPAAFDPAAIPEVVFSDPEIASVGHTESSAREAGIEPATFRFPFAAGSRSRTIGDHAGFVQLVADEDDTIIGAQLAGGGVSELVGELALAIELSATAYDVAATIHPHPSMSEAVAEAALGLGGRPLHVRRS